MSSKRFLGARDRSIAGAEDAGLMFLEDPERQPDIPQQRPDPRELLGGDISAGIASGLAEAEQGLAGGVGEDVPTNQSLALRRALLDLRQGGEGHSLQAGGTSPGSLIDVQDPAFTDPLDLEFDEAAQLGLGGPQRDPGFGPQSIVGGPGDVPTPGLEAPPIFSRFGGQPAPEANFLPVRTGAEPQVDEFEEAATRGPSAALPGSALPVRRVAPEETESFENPTHAPPPSSPPPAEFLREAELGGAQMDARNQFSAGDIATAARLGEGGDAFLDKIATRRAQESLTPGAGRKRNLAEVIADSTEASRRGVDPAEIARERSVGHLDRFGQPQQGRIDRELSNLMANLKAGGARRDAAKQAFEDFSQLSDDTLRKEFGDVGAGFFRTADQAERKELLNRQQEQLEEQRKTERIKAESPEKVMALKVRGERDINRERNQITKDLGVQRNRIAEAELKLKDAKVKGDLAAQKVAAEEVKTHNERMFKLKQRQVKNEEESVVFTRKKEEDARLRAERKELKKKKMDASNLALSMFSQPGMSRDGAIAAAASNAGLKPSDIDIPELDDDFVRTKTKKDPKTFMEEERARALSDVIRKFPGVGRIVNTLVGGVEIVTGDLSGSLGPKRAKQVEDQMIRNIMAEHGFSRKDVKRLADQNLR